MRVVVIGNVQFTQAMLEALQQSSATVVGVITGIEAGINADFCDLGAYCEQHKIPCYRTNQVNQVEVLEWVKNLQVDVVFCLGWSRLIKKELLELPPMGVIGFHPAKLPQNRGRHPLIWALALGLEETATTFFMMDEQADSGDIISQRSLTILKEDDAASLYQKMTKNAAQQIIELTNKLPLKTLNRTKQDDSSANVWRKRGMPDGEIDWRMSAANIHNLVRALSKPYVGAHFLYQGKEYKVWQSETVCLEGMQNIEPGKVLSLNDSEICIKCGEQAIKLLKVEPVIELKAGEYL